MHKKLTGLLSLSLLTAMSASAFADDGKWSVGASVLYQEQAYRGTKTSDKFMPVPMVNYEGKNFYFHTLATGYYLWNDKKDQLSVDLFYYPQAYRAKDNKDSRMRKLDNRRDTAMAGLSYRHHEEWGTLRTNFSGDILGKSDGMRFDAAYLYGFEGDSWSVQPGVGVIWSSEKQNRYEYGITDSESRRSGLDEYRPGSSWTPYIEVTGHYQFDENWSAFAMGRIDLLPSEAKDSPMVDKKYTSILWTGVTYTF